jgi:hypothetical protein
MSRNIAASFLQGNIMSKQFTRQVPDPLYRAPGVATERKRQRMAKLGKLGPASEVRRIDPRTGAIIGTIPIREPAESFELTPPIPQAEKLAKNQKHRLHTTMITEPECTANHPCRPGYGCKTAPGLAKPQACWHATPQ